MSLHTPRARRRSLRIPRRGFTLIEILVALAIFSVLLTIIMVPLSNGVTLTQIGSARADTQQAAQTTMNRIVSELRRASYVFPNEQMPGVIAQPPYFRTASGDGGACAAGVAPFNNTSRLEILVPYRASGAPVTQQQPLSIVSFYSARANVTKTWNEGGSYVADLNPVVMYRAQIPFLLKSGNEFINGGDPGPNALIDDRRYPPTAAYNCSNNAAYLDRGTRWLMHNGAGEPELARLDRGGSPNPAIDKEVLGGATSDQTEPASNNRITPLGVGMYAPQAINEVNTNSLADNDANGRVFTPSTSFICEDTNANGIIDRVTVTLVMGKYDSGNAESRAQNVRLTQTVDLPNVESRFGSPR